VIFGTEIAIEKCNKMLMAVKNVFKIFMELIGSGGD